MKQLKYFIFSFVVFQISCVEPPSKPAIKNTIIPVLYDRQNQVYNETEWEGIKDSYADNLLKIAKDKNDVEAYIQLAEVFIEEAKITGSYSHYYKGALRVLGKALVVNDISEDQKLRCISLKHSVLFNQNNFSKISKNEDSILMPAKH